MKKKTGFDDSQKGVRIDNIPATGAMTGHYEIDHHGCWWEYKLDQPNEHLFAWTIGDRPEED